MSSNQELSQIQIPARTCHGDVNTDLKDLRWFAAVSFSSALVQTDLEAFEGLIRIGCGGSGCSRFFDQRVGGLEVGLLAHKVSHRMPHDAPCYVL